MKVGEEKKVGNFFHQYNGTKLIKGHFNRYLYDKIK